MKIEVYNKKVTYESSYPVYAKEFVYRHRNIFNDKTIKRVLSNYPVIIKEIGHFRGEKTITYWIFSYDCYIVISEAKNDNEILEWVKKNIVRIKGGLQYIGQKEVNNE